MKIRTAIAAAAVVAVAPTLASAEKKISLKYLTAWDDRVQGTKLIGYAFGKKVEAATKGRIKISYSGPEVVKSRQQFQPVSRGVFDLNLSVAPYFMGVTAVAMGAFALHADTEDWRKKGYWQYFDEEMQRFNQKMIMHPVGGSGSDVFHVMLKRPVDSKSLQPLKGRKIRGNAFYTPVVDPLGGSRVNLNGGEIYSALQKGVVEGAAWPVQGAVDFKWYEVAKYMMRPRFGFTVTTLAMNLDRYRKLSAAHRGTLDDETRKLELAVLDRLTKMDEEEIAQLKRLGVKETWLDKKKFAELARARRNGMWALAARFNKKSAPYIEELHALARKHGLAE